MSAICPAVSTLSCPQSASSAYQSLEGLSVLIVGGPRIIRHNLQVFLEFHGCARVQTLADEDCALPAQGPQTGPPDAQAGPVEGPARPEAVDVIVLIPAAGGAFSAFYRMQQVQARHPGASLLVLSARLNRSEVYAAMRIGARGYVHQDIEPAELLQALHLVRSGKSYLSSEVSAMLMADLSAPPRARTARAGETHTTGGRPSLPTAELTSREVEIVQLLCEGLSSKQVARRLSLSTKTVENHRCNIYRKCGVDGAVALLRHAVAQGLVAI